MKDTEKYSYDGDQAKVHWDGRLCIHYGECAGAPPENCS
jgi:uncharacterized Fe-S cluster protein YjdI